MTNSDIYLFSLLVILCFAAFASIRSTNLLKSTILLSIFSLVMALVYVILQAPDVSITEAAIGGGISTMLFVAALSLTGQYEDLSDSRQAKSYVITSIFIVGAFGAVLLQTLEALPVFGELSAVSSHLGQHYIDVSESVTGVPNVVTSILASYRGFDTMGETFVIFAAGISVRLILISKKE